MTDRSERPMGGRAIARQAVRASLSDAARELFEERGIEGTSIEMIASAAGVASRTFYRHFESKEDLAMAWLDDPGPTFRSVLQQRPADEPIWLALRRAFDPVHDPSSRFAEQMRISAEMAYSSPALMKRIRDRVFDWEVLLSDVIFERLPEPRSHRDAELLAAWALSALRVAFERWREENDLSLELLGRRLDDAFEAATTLLVSRPS
ncbi:helix-turn-helix domain-containing protein [Rhodococcus sp. IEGM 1354]|uniref:TetR/AcrR family transcriptional regulator n=1 Tax=Rhodococcus sp. IEGM 1354 TaxID=3047088 RepID=UPI0024B82A3C|nr:TetR/AcrR family transcriptional regulator [Rhodococcus sp. IEGM 1354]MDI9933192.1 helix-turn-helix domain-containing protein [Rhodococcus sp. IEGM 1354]